MIFIAIILVSCKPSYEVPVESPNTETSSADTPYNIDFVQINNEIINTFQTEDHQKIFPFITDLEIDGNNDDKIINLNLSVIKNTSSEAILKLMSALTIQISNEAHVQDFRFSHPTESDFGSFFTVYSYHYTIKRGEDIFLDETIKQNATIPFDASQDFDTIISEISENK